MYAYFRDFLFSFRMMAQKPGLTLICILALGLGIGAVTTQYSVVSGSLFKGLPFDEPSELVHVKRWNVDRQPWNTEIPIHDFNDIVERQQSFEGLAGWFGGTINIAVDGTPYRFEGPRISHNFDDLLGVKALIGETFKEENDQPGAEPVAILSYGVWKRYFNGDPEIIHKTVRINGRVGRIIGVMGEGFEFPFRAGGKASTLRSSVVSRTG